MAARTHVVEKGDTLAKIAKRYGTTVERLVALNQERYSSLADDASLIRVGWELRLETATANPYSKPNSRPAPP